MWLDEDRPRAVADVSSTQGFYNIIDYGDVLEAVAYGIEQHGTDIHGQATLSPSGHRMTAQIDFSDATIQPAENDTIQLGLHIQTGHSGFHALKYDVGAERQICSNGMVAFVSDLHYEQTHQEPFQPGLAHQAVDAVIQGTNTVENRLEEAQEHEFINADEAVLTLLDHDIDWYVDTDGPDGAADLLRDALHEELDNGDTPTLYDTYNAATRAITHQDQPDYRRAEGLERAANLLETGGNRLPNVETVAQDAIETRLHDVIEADDQDDVARYWEDEDDRLRDLVEQRCIAG